LSIFLAISLLRWLLLALLVVAGSCCRATGRSDKQTLPIWEVDVSWGYLPLGPGKQTASHPQPASSWVTKTNTWS